MDCHMTDSLLFSNSDENWKCFLTVYRLNTLLTLHDFINNVYFIQYYINDAVGIVTLKVAAGTPTDLAQTSHLLLFVTVVQTICCIHWCCNLWCNDTVMIIMCMSTVVIEDMIGLKGRSTGV